MIFLDIDGVLNGHDWDQGAMSTRIQYRCICNLNTILRRTDAKVVISSAWRYMLLRRKRPFPPCMTLTGFEILLRTHGACGIVDRIIGTTIEDEQCAHCGHKNRKGHDWKEGYPVCMKCGKHSTRGDQVTHWLFSNAVKDKVSRYVVIDDLDLGFTELGHPLILTNGKWGLSRHNANDAIKVLKE